MSQGHAMTSNARAYRVGGLSRYVNPATTSPTPRKSGFRSA